MKLYPQLEAEGPVTADVIGWIHRRLAQALPVA